MVPYPYPPRLTASPGSGGDLSTDPADFRVDEILAYPTEGVGEHVYVRIEKTDLDTLPVLDRVGRALGLPDRAVGYAGLKDRRAVATQWISFPWPIAAGDPPLGACEGDGLRVLEWARHGHKLRRGHQRGNRFEIVVRGTVPGGAALAEATLSDLRRTGIPNAFGPQRFGRDGDNAIAGLEMLRGARRPPKARRLRDLYLSAVQSAVFNSVLAARMERGWFETALLGDVMTKHDTHGQFVVEDVAEAQDRLTRLEISPTGPLPGKRMRAAAHDAHALEAEAIDALGLDDRAWSRLPDGTRRPLRTLVDPEARIVPLGEDAYRLEVTLPSGSYATVLLDELFKPDDGPFRRGPTAS